MKKLSTDRVLVSFSVDTLPCLIYDNKLTSMLDPLRIVFAGSGLRRIKYKCSATEFIYSDLAANTNGDSRSQFSFAERCKPTITKIEIQGMVKLIQDFN